MPTSRVRSCVLLAPLLVLWSLGPRADEPIGAGRPRPCGAAQLIDSELRCDEELLGDRRELCPLVLARPLTAGDAVDGCEVGRMPPADLAALNQPVDINHASLDELASLPGIGPVIAARIVAGRPYPSVDSLDAVSGIGPAKLAALRARARVRPATR